MNRKINGWNKIVIQSLLKSFIFKETTVFVDHNQLIPYTNNSTAINNSKVKENRKVEENF